MAKNKIGLVLVCIAIVASIGQVIYFAPQLPESVSSHFGANGKPNASMSKAGFLAFYMAMQLGLVALLLGIAATISRIPDSMLNIPNKEYWLHPDRRATTLASNQSILIWIAALTAFFMVLVFQLTIDANLNKKSLNSVAVWWLVIGYLLLLFMICFWKLRPFFHQPPQVEPKSESETEIFP